MTRMSREFSLVLLGAGLLTTGYLVWPEQEFEKRSEEQARNRVGTRSHGGFLFLGHLGGPRSSTVRGGGAGLMGSVSKGGLGSIGSRVASGGG
jgi:hypothetical protein